MSSKKRKSLGAALPEAAVSSSIEEQRKRARLWKEQQLTGLAPKELIEEPTAAGGRNASRRASMSAVQYAPQAKDMSSPKRNASSRKSLVPQIPPRRKNLKETVTASVSPPPKRAKAVATSSSVEEQRERARLWKEENLKSDSTPQASKNSKKIDLGTAEAVPQPVFSESEIPESLRPSREASAATKLVPRSHSSRRATLDSAPQRPPVVNLRGKAIRASIAGGNINLSARKNTARTPPYVSPAQESSEEEDTVPLMAPARRSAARATFSGARRSSAGSSTFDDSIYSYPADFRHQFKERNAAAELSSPETVGDLSPLVHTRATPSTSCTKRSARQTSSVKKKLLPPDSESEDDTAANSRLSFSQQKERAKKWRDSALGSSPDVPLPRTGTPVKKPVPSVEEVFDKSAEPLEPQIARSVSSSQQKKNDAWLREVMFFLCGVALVASLIVVRAHSMSGANNSLSLLPFADLLPTFIPAGLTHFIDLKNGYKSIMGSINNGVDLTLSSLRAITLLLLAVAVVIPIIYGIFVMIRWCWNNAQKRSNLIETMADEAKDMLFTKYEGGPYPVIFLMEILMDKYKREGCGKATELLSPGETLNRAAFRKLWPSVEKEVTSDARIEVLNRTFEGKLHVCWRVVGGKGTINSTHIASDFSTDDFGHEDAYSKSDYTPAKVHGSGFSFL